MVKKTMYVAEGGCARKTPNRNRAFVQTTSKVDTNLPCQINNITSHYVLRGRDREKG